MAAKFQTKRSRARYSWNGFDPADMERFGNLFLDHIKARIRGGLDVNDRPAPPLSERWRRLKGRRYGSTYRDLMATGRTIRGLRVLRVDQNKATLGPADPVAERRIAFNRPRSIQWGSSPRDRDYIGDVIRRSSVVGVKEAA